MKTGTVRDAVEPIGILKTNQQRPLNHHRLQECEDCNSSCFFSDGELHLDKTRTKNSSLQLKGKSIRHVPL